MRNGEQSLRRTKTTFKQPGDVILPPAPQSCNTESQLSYLFSVLLPQACQSSRLAVSSCPLGPVFLSLYLVTVRTWCSTGIKYWLTMTSVKWNGLFLREIYTVLSITEGSYVIRLWLSLLETEKSILPVILFQKNMSS